MAAEQGAEIPAVSLALQLQWAPESGASPGIKTEQVELARREPEVAPEAAGGFSPALQSGAEGPCRSWTEPRCIKEEPEEHLSAQQWEVQWQEFLRTVQASDFERKGGPQLLGDGAWVEAKASGSSTEGAAIPSQGTGAEETKTSLPSGSAQEFLLRQQEAEKAGQQGLGAIEEGAVHPPEGDRSLLDPDRRLEPSEVLQNYENKAPLECLQVDERQEGNLPVERATPVVILQNCFQRRTEETPSWSEKPEETSEHQSRPRRQQKSPPKNRLSKSASHADHLLWPPRIRGAKEPHRCSFCGKSFDGPSHLLIHERTHTGEKPYKCSVCGKSFSRTSNMLIHERTHTGEKPYKCSLCGKHFRCSWHLAEHDKTHTGERPFPCPSCGKSFRSKSQVVRHQRIHLGKKP